MASWHYYSAELRAPQTPRTARPRELYEQGCCRLPWPFRYTWNSERSLAIALRVKQRLPETLLLVGGPEVQPDNVWLVAHPAVDMLAFGEGEQTFAALLAALVAMRGELLDAVTPVLATWLDANPSTIVDIYLLGDEGAPLRPSGSTRGGRLCPLRQATSIV